MAEELNIKDFWKDTAGIEPETIVSTEIPPIHPDEKNIELPVTQTTPAELSDDELLSLLQKRGVNLKSFEDLKPKATPEEIEAEKQQRNNNVYAFGLKEGKIKKEDLDNLAKAEADKVKFLFNDFAGAAKKANPEITDSEIEEDWKEYTLYDLSDDNFKKQLRIQELNELADYKLKNQFKNVFSLENDYAKHEAAENENYSLKRKVEAAYPVYQKDIDEVITSLKLTKYTIEDTQNAANNVEIELSYSDADLKELKDAFLKPEQIIKRIKDGYTVEAIKGEADMFLWNKHKGRHLSKAAKDYNSKQQEKYQAGRKGIIPNKELVIAGDETPSNITTSFWKDVIPTAPAATDQSNTSQKN